MWRISLVSFLQVVNFLQHIAVMLLTVYGLNGLRVQQLSIFSAFGTTVGKHRFVKIDHEEVPD